MTAEERMLKVLFNIPGPTEKKNIHDLTPEERNACNNGQNSSIVIETEDFIVTGGTLEERCILTDADVDMINTLVETSIEEILGVNNEEEIHLYIFEDTIIVLSDVYYESLESRTYYLPIDTDLSVFEGIEDIKINDLR